MAQALSRWPLAPKAFAPSVAPDTEALKSQFVSGLSRPAEKPVSKASSLVGEFDQTDFADLREMQKKGIAYDKAVDAIRRYKQGETQTAPEEKPTFQDQHADEGMLEQTVKAPFRAVGGVAQSIVGGAEKAFAGGVNLLEKGISSATGLELPGYQAELWPTAAGLGRGNIPTMQDSALSNVTAIPAGISGTMFNLGKAPMAAGINLASELPGAQYVTQGLGKVIEGAGSAVGSAIGDEQAGQNIVETGLNVLGTRMKGAGTAEVGQAFQKGGLGAAIQEAGGSALKTAKDVTTLPVTAPLAAGKAVLSKVPKGASEFVSTKANRFNALDEQKFMQATGETPGEFAVSRGMKKVGEPAVEEAVKNWQESKKQADTSFAAIEGKFSTKNLPDDVVGDLMLANKAKIEAQPRNPGAGRVKSLFAKYESGQGLTMSEINEMKRFHSSNYKYVWPDVYSDAARNATQLQDAVRDWQFKTAAENGLTNIAEINKTTQGWKMYADSLAKKLDRSRANDPIGITDWIALSGGLPTNLALTAGKLLGSTRFAKEAAIKALSVGKEAKPAIVPADLQGILKSNVEKSADFSLLPRGTGAGGEALVRPPEPAKQLPAPKGEPTIKGTVNVKPEIGRKPGILEKTSKAIEGQAGKEPGTSKPKVLEQQKLLPAPRLPEGTSYPRTDVSAESMREAGKGLKRTKSKSAPDTQRPQRELGTSPRTSRALYRGSLQGKRPTAEYTEKIQGLKRAESPEPTLPTWEVPKTPDTALKTVKNEGLSDPRTLLQQANDASSRYSFFPKNGSAGKIIFDEMLQKLKSPSKADIEFLKKAIEQTEGKDAGVNPKTGEPTIGISRKDFIQKVKELSKYDEYKAPSVMDKAPGEKITIHRAGDPFKSSHGGLFFTEKPEIAKEVYGVGGRDVNPYEVTIPEKSQMKTYRSVYDAYMDVGEWDGKRDVIREIQKNPTGELPQWLKSDYPSLMKGYGTTDWQYNFNRKLDKAVAQAMKEKGIKLVEYTNPEDLGFAQMGLSASEYMILDDSILKRPEGVKKSKK